MAPESGGRVSEDVDELERIEGLAGDTGSDPEKEGVMHSVLPHDEDVDDGKLLAESYDYNLSSFQPDLLFDQLTQNYRQAQKLYGETLIRELTGYDDGYVEKNINIPEFRTELKKRVEDRVEELRKKKLLDEEGRATEEGVRLATIVRYTEELERLTTRGYGREERHERGLYGERADHKAYRGERFRDVDVRQSIRKATRRGRRRLRKEDLVASERHERAKVTIIYAVDASGSMRGPKLGMAKRAGVALAYQAINDRNDVGLVVFTSKIENSLAPSREFPRILEALTVVRAGLETDIALTIEEATRLFRGSHGTKHLVLLTDALPTRTSENKAPRRRVLEAASAARGAGITISLVGISLDEDGESLARRVTEVGDGKLYLARSADDLDMIVLEDYETFARNT